ncbi:MAG: DUF2905 domain-containing protein [Candidatus Angelobacter sp.]
MQICVIRGESIPGNHYNRVMAELGKLLLILGGIIVVVGLALIFAARFNLPVSRLPGDFVYRGKNTTFYFPLATSILLSIILSLIFWLFSRGGR